MNTPLVLLKLLSDNQVHSGSDIGKSLGISRAAVWKQIQKVQNLGIVVNSVKGVGYQLQDKLDLIDVENLRHELVQQQFCMIEYCFEIDSTNSYLQRLLNAGQAKPGYCVIAEMQTTGRGRRGNRWLSPFAQNIYMSLLYRFDGGLAAIEGLSLAVGVSVVQTLHEEFGITLSLKWPNDIIAAGKKYGGILIDIAGESDGRCHAIIGLGLNVHMQKADGAIAQAWGSLDQLNASVTRTAISAAVLKRLLVDLSRFGQAGFSGFAEGWKLMDAFAGKEVMVNLGSEFVFGRCVGVTVRGELRVMTPAGERIFTSGEVSLRLA